MAPWRGSLSALAAVAVGVLAGMAQASPVDIFGAGFEGRAMSSARTALDVSGAATYYDPANLAMATATRLNLSVSSMNSSLNYNGMNGGNDSFVGAELGMVLPLPGLLRGAAIGLYGFFPADDLGRIVARDADSPQFLQAGQIHGFAMFGGLAYKLGPVAAGVGIQYLTSASGSLNLTTNEAAATVSQGTLQLDLVPTAAFVGGLAVDALPYLRIGASYRGAGGIQVQLPSNVNLGPLELQLVLNALTYWRPPTWNAGVGYHGKWISADADFSYLQWSQIPDPTLSTNVQTSSNLLPTLQSGSWGLKLQDTPAFRIGVDVPLPLGFALLAGYSYDPTPVPAQTGPTNILDNDRHTIGVGASFSFKDMLGLSSGPMTVGVAAQYQAMPTRQTEKASPLDLYGDASYGGNLFTVGGTITMRFGDTP